MDHQRVLFVLGILCAAQSYGCYSGSGALNDGTSGGQGGAAATTPGPTGGSGQAGSSAGQAQGATGLPCDVNDLLVASCQGCHSSPPSPGTPMALVTYGDLTAPSKSNASKTAAQASLDRMRSTTSPMPPGAPPSASQIAVLSAWLSAGLPKGTCGTATPPADSGVPLATPDAALPPPGATGLPCDLAQMLAKRCDSCHSSPPSPGTPMALVTYGDLTAPSKSNASKTAAQASLDRMQSAANPMPPSPASPPTAAEIALLSGWITSGSPKGSCAADAGGPDSSTSPYGTPVVCTSKRTYSGGGSSQMNPGQACISCHKTNPEAPVFVLAGTVFPTAHEPDLCYGASSANLTVVVTDAKGASVTMTVNAAGNFSRSGALATPYSAKVVSPNGERVMVSKQTSGDCNSCHTEAGANGAPGRIMAP